MKISSKLIRKQLSVFKPFVSGCSLKNARRGQDKLGGLMASIYKSSVKVAKHNFGLFEGAMITPKDEVGEGIILYLHGGGYTCGDLEYAKGFGSVLAAKCGLRVFCAAYRLAPESIFPAAVDDALLTYHYLIRKGYPASSIVLCGESAGGGLIYALCLKLKSLGEPLPAGLIGISPWTDLTSSGASYQINREIDPSMTQERLKYFADCYIHGDQAGISDPIKDSARKRNPLVSPIFGNLSSFPPSLIFVGGDEIMLDDARGIHERLLSYGNRSQLVVTPHMWHAYVLYCLDENENDFVRIRSFLRSVLPAQKKLRWMKLDNSAKIFPASRSRNWTNVFRLSATLKEPVDCSILQSALDVTIRRFPSIAVRIRCGLFWYYLEEIPKAPEIQDEKSYPLVRMPFDDIRKCAFRVVSYRNRIAIEVFHALTDGNGGLVFLKTLVAEYLSQKYGITIPSTDGVLNRLEEPDKAELEDSFLRNCGKVSAGRREANSYKLYGTREADGYLTDTTFMMSAATIHRTAKAYGVTVTAFLASVMLCALAKIQAKEIADVKKRKMIRVLIPVNLRPLFGSRTLRNFVLYTSPGIDPKLGEYQFDEVCKLVQHYMGLEITSKQMSTKITTNVNSEKSLIVKIMPLFIKNLVLKAFFNAVGERKSCFSLSNLGVVRLPEVMKEYIERMDFVLGVQSKSPYNCGVITYGDTLYFNIISNIKEPILEYPFYEELRGLGIHVKVESNRRD